MHLLSAGDGYTYYTNEVATGDVHRESGRELGDYYLADGNPPGQWMGGGTELLGMSGEVTEAQMKALFGEGLHPDADRIIADAMAEGKTREQALKAAKLGRSYYAFQAEKGTLAADIREAYSAFERVNHRDPDTGERRQIRAKVGAQAFREAKGREPSDKEELGRFMSAATRPKRQAVAGMDLVCSPSKSVSVMWALGSDETRTVIEVAQDDAVRDTIRYVEQHAIATRSGTNGIAQIDIKGGVTVTKFRHYDSRTGDPQLHDHLVIANKVMGADGKWRTIDSRLLHRMNVPASEYYNARVMQLVTERLGFTTELRSPTSGKRPVLEIAGLDPELLDEFSSRSIAIRSTTAVLVEQYRDEHGREPNQKALIAIAQRATLDTRPEKEHSRSLHALREDWKARGALRVGYVEGIESGPRQAAAVALENRRELDAEDLHRIAEDVLNTVQEHHAVWGAHVIEAEARRHVAHLSSALHIPENFVDDVARSALSESISLTPPVPHGAFQPLTREDGTSIYEHKGAALFTSAGILAAEDALLEAGRTRTVSPITVDTFERAAAAHEGPLDQGQRDLARAFATSDSVLLVGIGPAGAGKTTALQLAADALHQGGVRMIGLAPSAPAAAVMSDKVGIAATTIHGFLEAHEKADVLPEAFDIMPGDVIVVDEAGMAGTKRLADVVAIAKQAGAHVRLIGDDRQLSAVEAGGALRLLDREIGSVELEHLHRFLDTEEAAASLHLRDPLRPGDPFTWYRDNNRIVGGTPERMADEVFAHWQRDTDAGIPALMLARTTDKVTTLNARAQAYQIASGAVNTAVSVPLRDGLNAHVGDIITTRRNDSQLRIRDGRDRVKNGDLWHVTGISGDGTLTVKHTEHAAPITLPADYVEQHVEIGYARTIGRSQGLTTGNTYTLGDGGMSREDTYVPLSRGAIGNYLFLELEHSDTVDDALQQIAGRYDGMLSAHETIRAEQDRVDNILTLTDQHADVAARADEIRYAHVAELALGEDTATRLAKSDSWGAVAASLRHAEDYGFDPVDTLRDAYRQRELGSADDVPAVLSWRIDRALKRGDVTAVPVTERPTIDGVPAWIADASAHDRAHLPSAWADHLRERHAYIGARLREHGAALALEPPAWAKDLGPVPSKPQRLFAWQKLAAEIDVFRQRYRISDTEQEAIPDRLRGREIADHLAARVTATHKAAALTTALEASEGLRALIADSTTQRAAAARTATINRVALTPTRTGEPRMTDPLEHASRSLSTAATKTNRALSDAVRAAGQLGAERDRELLRRAERDERLQRQTAMDKEREARNATMDKEREERNAAMEQRHQQQDHERALRIAELERRNTEREQREAERSRREQQQRETQIRQREQQDQQLQQDRGLER